MQVMRRGEDWALTLQSLRCCASLAPKSYWVKAGEAPAAPSWLKDHRIPDPATSHLRKLTLFLQSFNV